mmetsp:Transcript_40332/g.68796  ORF Transcript_40332/g.68796 Transcript_40332/m.68796 type:complete len:125 (+) Transcript_40332:154-528(+)
MLSRSIFCECCGELLSMGVVLRHLQWMSYRIILFDTHVKAAATDSSTALRCVISSMDPGGTAALQCSLLSPAPGLQPFRFGMKGLVLSLRALFLIRSTVPQSCWLVQETPNVFVLLYQSVLRDP